MAKSNSLSFNQKSLAAIRPDAKSLAALGFKADKYGKVDLFDTQMPGLALRMMATGRKTYYFTYRMGGRGHNYKWLRISRFEDLPLKAARERARACRADVDRGVDPTEKKRAAAARGATIAEVVKRFFEEYALENELGPKTISDYAKFYRQYVMPAFGRTPIKDLDLETIDRWHKRIPDKDGRGRMAANRALSFLSSVCTRAEVWKYRPQGSNPCKYVKPFTEIARKRDIQTAELEAIGDAVKKLDSISEAQAQRDYRGRPKEAHEEPSPCNLWALAAIKVISLCAGRVNEVLHLRRDMDVFLDEGYAIIRNHKTSAKSGSKRLELPPPAVEVLRKLPEMEGNPWYFPRPISNEAPLPYPTLKRVWDKICAMANVSDLHLHDFRSFAASEALAHDIDSRISAKILGHGDSRTTEKHYLKVRLPKVAEAAEITSAPVAKAFGLRGKKGKGEP
jgi:integrase